jgi:hypothetical protein
MSEVKDYIDGIYNEYDSGEISDSDALYQIIDIINREHPIFSKDIDKIKEMYNSGDIDSGDYLMRVMDIVYKIYK